MKRELSVNEGAAAERLDVFLAARLGVTRNRAQALLKAGAVRVNGREGRASYTVQAGDHIAVDQPEVRVDQPPAPELPVVYEDADILVIDKPAGLTVHAGSGTQGEATVADFARPRTTDTDPGRPGIVHRLDRDTSGLMVLAKTPAAKAYLQEQFRNHKVVKTYQALVVGRPDNPSATIRLPLDRDPAHPLRRAVVPGGREAVTSYETLAAYPGYTYIRAQPRTGRTHQLRVHFAALGHPIAGDIVYGAPRRPLGLERHFLHAAALSFTAPSGQQLSLESPLPSELEHVLGTLQKAV